MSRFGHVHGKHVRPTRSRTAQLAALATLTAGVAVWLPVGAAQAACALVPQLRDVAVNQGEGQYTRLVRGKTTIVKTYLSLPACAVTGDSISVTSATVNVSFGGTT